MYKEEKKMLTERVIKGKMSEIRRLMNQRKKNCLRRERKREKETGRTDGRVEENVKGGCNGKGGGEKGRKVQQRK